MRLRRRNLGSLFSEAQAATPAAPLASSTVAPVTTQSTLAAQAAAATPTPPSTAVVVPIIDTSGTAVIVPTVTASSTLASQAAAAVAQQNPTPAESAADIAAAEDLAAIQLMHNNASLASNASNYLAPDIMDAGAVGAPPSYIALPTYPPSNNPGNVPFPYNNPPPHWTANEKWWTGQTLLNVGAPQYSNDPWEYLRSALVDTNIPMLQNWIAWYFAALGKPASTVYASAQPWAQALQNLDLAQNKYIQTSEGPVFLPFSYADLTALQQGTAQWEYGYDPATLASYLAQWVAAVLPDVSQFPESVRLDPATDSPPASPYPTNNLPAIFRQGSSFFATIAPYLGVASIALTGGLLAVLAPASGIGSALENVTDVTTGFASGGATSALTAGADAGLEAGSDLTDITVLASLEPESTAAETILPEAVVTASAPVAIAPTTALTAVAAAGASTALTPDLEEIDVTAQAPTGPDESELDLTAAAPDLAAAVNSAPTVNFPSNSQLPTPSNSTLSSLGGALAKLFGGSAGAASDASDTGVTGTDGGAFSDWLGSLSGTDWLVILAMGLTGLYFVHESRPKRKAHAP
ncbi:MAG: hypothetical protein ACRD33_00060 [Candidatus Acidiferrales bacterium]